MSTVDSTLSTRLSSVKLGPIVSKIVKDSAELSTLFFTANNQSKNTIVQNIKNDYVELCEFLGRTMPVDEYIEDKDLSGGWDWVLNK